MKNTATSVVLKLRNKGYEAYWAGGCVRDMLLGLKPKDFDIVTNAKPEEIKKIFSNSNEVGKSFGVIIVRINDYNFEIATFRKEGRYKDARHPEKIYFSNAVNDAKRRDFTINAMFYDPINEKLIDFVHGKKDLDNKIIRFIGNPNLRIKEDNLRLLRAIRFKNKFNFEYEKRTWESIKNNAFRIQSVSAERISQELNKIFGNKNRADALIDLSDSGLLQYILPEIEKLKGVVQPDKFHKEGDVFKHTYFALKALPDKSPMALIWAVLLHDTGKPATISYPKDNNDRIRFNKHVKYSAGIASRVCRRLKMPNSERELIVWLVKNHMLVGDILKMKISKKRKILMDPKFKWLLALHKADALGARPKDLNMFNDILKEYQHINREYDKEKNNPKFKLFINGQDLIRKFNLEQGPKIGKILKDLEIKQLEGNIKNKQQAFKYIKENYL